MPIRYLAAPGCKLAHTQTPIPVSQCLRQQLCCRSCTAPNVHPETVNGYLLPHAVSMHKNLSAVCDCRFLVLPALRLVCFRLSIASDEYCRPQAAIQSRIQMIVPYASKLWQKHHSKPTCEPSLQFLDIVQYLTNVSAR